MSDLRDEEANTALADDWPQRARLGVAVETSAGLCLLVGLLGLVIVVVGGKNAPAWIGGVTLVFLLCGVCWALVVGGLLLAFSPRAMAGSIVEIAALTSKTSRRTVGLILAWTGAWWAGIALLVWAIHDRRLDLQTPPLLLLACVLAANTPFLMLALAIPPVGRRRRSRTAS